MKLFTKFFKFILILFVVQLTLKSNLQAQTMDWNKAGDETVKLFQEYLSIKTYNLPGDVTGAVEFFSSVFEREGVPYEIKWTDKANGKGNVIAHLKGSGKKRPIAMLNHMDTVPVDRAGWSVDPLKGVIKDGRIYGRGALDMKNNGIVQMMTMVFLKRNNIPLDRDVFFIAVADEEITGTLGAVWIAENMWDQINAEFILDEGGFGTQGFFTNDDKLIYSVGVAEKMVLWIKMKAKGSTGHGSMPPKDNPNFIMASALGKIADYETPITITPVVAEMKKRLGGTLADTPYNNALQRNTISLTVMNGFVGNPPKSNVIPNKSEAVLDCRLLPGQDPEQFIADLKKLINDDRIEFEYLSYPDKSLVGDFDTEVFRAIEKETKAEFPESVTLPHLIIYGTDSRVFRPLGATCYGFFPGAVTMAEYKRIHGNDESLRVESLKSAMKIYYNVVKSVSEKN